MVTSRLGNLKNAEEPMRAAAAAPQTPPAPVRAGGNPWFALVVNLLLMPAIAYGLTTYILIPRIESARPTAAVASKESDGNSSRAGKSVDAKARITVPLAGKILVNVAGTAGTRFIVSSITMVGKSPDFRDRVERNDPQLRDAAAGIFSSKTLNDIDKPGMRNLIRAELISAFNEILGKEAVVDLYLTELAIQ